MPVTHYIWDEVNDTLLMEKDEAGNTIAEYTHEPGQFGPLISQHRNGQTRYHHFDGQGSTRQLTDANGIVTDSKTHTAFGETVASSGTTTNLFGFKGAIGYYLNPATEDLSVRARDYRPYVARWLDLGPSLRLAPNPYLLAANNPVRWASVSPPSGERGGSSSGLAVHHVSQELTGHCGGAKWTVGFVVEDGSANGYLVQRIQYDVRVYDCCTGRLRKRSLAYAGSGCCPTPVKGETVNDAPPQWWESWTVRKGKIFGGDIDSPVPGEPIVESGEDTWLVADEGTGTRGTVTIQGGAKIIATVDLKPWDNCVVAAGILFNTTKKPGEWSDGNALHRSMKVTWNCCGRWISPVLETDRPS